MVRFTILLAVLVVHSAASRAEPAPAEDPCTTSPKDASMRAMAIKLFQPAAGSKERLIAAAPGTEFPAISKDGSTIVQLFGDSEDYSAAPIMTLVFWSKTGKPIATYRLGGAANPAGPQTGASDLARYEDKLLHDANARLAATRWRPLATHTACIAAPEGSDATPDGYPARSTLHLDDVTITFDTTKGRLTSTAGRQRAKPLTAGFPEPGRRMAPDSGSCGDIRGLAAGFGSRAIGIAVLVPSVSLGGDSCFGLASADLAIAVPLR